MSEAKPTKRRAARQVQRRPVQRGTAGKGGGQPMTEEERQAHALSQRRAFVAAMGVTVFAAAFIVLVLVLNQLPWQ